MRDILLGIGICGIRQVFRYCGSCVSRISPAIIYIHARVADGARRGRLNCRRKLVGDAYIQAHAEFRRVCRPLHVGWIAGPSKLERPGACRQCKRGSLRQIEFPTGSVQIEVSRQDAILGQGAGNRPFGQQRIHLVRDGSVRTRRTFGRKLHPMGGIIGIQPGYGVVVRRRQGIVCE